MSSVAKTIDGIHITGILREKKGMYYAVICYRDADNNRKQKWYPTKLPVRGNKKNADVILKETLDAFELPYEELYAFRLKGNKTIMVLQEESIAERRIDSEIQTFEVSENMQLEELTTEQIGNLYFADYIKMFLPHAKKGRKRPIEETTYAGYCSSVKNPIYPYFKEKGIRLNELCARDIQDFYDEQLARKKPNGESLKASTVIHYHAIIRLSLCYARKHGYILSNPIEEVDKPEKNIFVGKFYSESELVELIRLTKDTKLEIPVIMAGVYGLRRSEVIGLRWSAFDFENDVFYINHTVTTPYVDGKRKIIAKDRAKNKASLRAMPLSAEIKTRLIEIKERQQVYIKKFKRSYNREWIDYLNVDELGELVLPDYVSETFDKFLDKHKLRDIRYHDLRHTSASLLLNKGKGHGITLKDVQIWLGHSDFATTANIYAHLDATSKMISMNVMTGLVTA